MDDRVARTSPPLVRPMQDAVDDVARRLALLAVPVWLLPVVLGALRSGWPTGSVLGATAIAATGYLAFHRVGGSVTMLVGLGASVIWLAAHSPTSGSGLVDDLWVEHWVNLSCWTAGVLLASVPRAGSVVILTPALVVTTLLLRAQQAGVAVDAEGLAALVAYGLADGFAAIAAFGVMRRSARASDARIARGSSTAAQLAQQQTQQLEAQRVARIMHDTVVNTLGAIQRWTLPDRDAIVRRAAADLETLRALDTGGVTQAAELVANARHRGALLGLDLVVHDAGDLPDLPVDVADALQGACWESLNNIAKHSGSRAAELRCERQGEVLVLTVTDFGRGFDPTLLPDRGGLTTLIAHCAEVGVDARVQSSLGAGTTVTLRWDNAAIGRDEPVPPVLEDTAALEADLAASVGWITLVLGTFGLVAMLRVGAHFGSWTGAAAFIVMLWLGLATRRASQRGAVVHPPPWVYSALGAFVVAAPSWGVHGCARVGNWWWGPFAALTVGAYAAILDARRSAVIATILGTCSGYLLAVASLVEPLGTCRQDTLAAMVLQAGLILALGAARRQHQRIHAFGVEAARAAARDHIEAVRANETVRLRRVQMQMASSVAAPVLQGLADGTLDPEDPSVRARAGAAEATLRLLAMLPSIGVSPLAAALGQEIMRAHERGVRLRLTLGNMGRPDRAQARRIGMALDVVFDACEPGSTVQVTVFETDGVLHLLAVSDVQFTTRATAMLTSAGWVVSAGDTETLLEMEIGAEA